MDSKRKAPYGCSGHKEKTCDFKVPKKVCGVTLKAADLDSLFKNGQTQTIKGFPLMRLGGFDRRLHGLSVMTVVQFVFRSISLKNLIKLAGWKLN